MPFEPGQSGNPGGRTKGTPWADALRIAALEKSGDKTLLRKIADKCVEQAIEGDPAARKELGDRLDGKPKQAVELSGTGDDGSIKVEMTDTELARRTLFTMEKLLRATSPSS